MNSCYLQELSTILAAMTVVDMLNIVCFDDLTPPHPDFEYDIGETIEGSKYFIPIVDDALKPKTNAQYATLKNAEKMYRDYADKAGFDVRDGGCYEIYEFVEAHNHALFNVNDRRFSRKNRQMKCTDFKTILNSSSYKVGARRAHRIQTALNGGFEHTRVSEIDFKNFKRDAVACVGNKDAQMLINKLSNRRDIVPGYLFEYKCNAQELIAIFWADEVSRIKYKEFGDVISFDGTFRTNKHAMIFVPFLAVDNHKASVVIGFALISGETIENFTWVLKAFLNCHEKQPVFVITDQCSAMKQAILMVFTEAKHILCMWHIMKKVPSKVSVALNQDPNFNKVISKLVWNIHIGPAEFEHRWHEMIEQYNLGGDTWFTDMYAIRHSLIPAFYKNTPMSGLMKTTSRSESSNSYINIYESYWFDLVQFLNNYDVAIEKQRYRQPVHETVTRTTNPKFVTPLRLESYASSIYSRNVFFDIQKEIKKDVWCCAIENIKCRDVLKSFVISHKTKKSSENITYLVNRNYSTDTVEYECNLFTRNDYLCRHAFKIQSARVRYGEVDAEKEKCIIDVYSKVDEIISIARNDKSILARLERNLNTFMVDIEKEVPYEDPSQQKLDAIREHLGVSIPDEVDILPPSGIRNKGCETVDVFDSAFIVLEKVAYVHCSMHDAGISRIGSVNKQHPSLNVAKSCVVDAM
ncbi:protein FAR1-RELATED SEQUENCE 5-like [Cynara cardunculus var. scolymus]|uniref:protein FAR1-RELATED SEQUENCE 5-like n=1 Tax=Cynara cardunculus var. scolymus TaxID=59895 RepID=UPI000D628EF3|nr:protein FAR1-RELATED SEQUENCE 5-like [Cynara cardunculus var. scolymus]